MARNFDLVAQILDLYVRNDLKHWAFETQSRCVPQMVENATIKHSLHIVLSVIGLSCQVSY